MLHSKRRFVIAIILVICCLLVYFILNYQGQEKQDHPVTEKFILTWLINENGTIATYRKENPEVDKDLVKGREALSESLGLWMLYAIQRGDKQLFTDSYQMLQKYFLEKDGFVNWKINEEGKSEVNTNALVDDLRIIKALLMASEKWKVSEYRETAVIIGRFISQHNKVNNILTDFYDQHYRYSNDVITLSYIDPEIIKRLITDKLMDEDLGANTLAILNSSPVKNGFFPKSYNIMTGQYQYDDKVNLIDQTLVAYYQEKIGVSTTDYLQFIMNEMATKQLVYGVYNSETKTPAVAYESPAVYALLVLYCLEVDEQELANQLYNRMVTFRVNDKNDLYYGGYSVNEAGDTHIFDNLVPLIAETALIENNQNE